MHAQLTRAAALVAFLAGLSSAQTQLAVPSGAVSAAAVQVSAAIGGRLITCPPKLGLSSGAVCLLANGSAASFKPRISQKFKGAVTQDWQTGRGGSNSLVVQTSSGVVFVLLAQAGNDVLAVVSPPTRGGSGASAPPRPTASTSSAATPATSAASTSAALPSGATRGVAYVKASDLRPVTSVTVLNSGQYRVGSASRFITFTPGNPSGQLAGAPYTLPGTPYLTGGQLYVPVEMLRELGCTVTAPAGQTSATVLCSGATVRVAAVTY